LQKGIYQHYKGNNYELIDTVTHSETEELMVLYKPLYGEKKLWVRPYDMFFENVLINSQEVPRFKYIGNAHG
jgi:hypothetical protein